MTGLVLEGGAMRGMYTAGILDVMMANDIPFDGVIGVSAGGITGCNYISRQPGRTIRYNLRFARDPRYCSAASLFLTGDLYGAKFDYDTIPHKLDPFDDRTFAENPTAFYVVVTDVETGAPVYHELKTMDETDLKWLRASASMPMFSRTVVLDGKGYLDGGISDSIPLKAFQEMGYAKNVVILTQPASYVKKPQKNLGLMKRLMKSESGVLADIETRHTDYNATLRYIADEEKAGTTFVFRPEEALPVNHVTHDREKLQSMYDTGVSDATRRLSELKEFLER